MHVPPAPWRSGYAAACKAVYTGSIPVGAFATPATVTRVHEAPPLRRPQTTTRCVPERDAPRPHSTATSGGRSSTGTCAISRPATGAGSARRPGCAARCGARPRRAPRRPSRRARAAAGGGSAPLAQPRLGERVEPVQPQRVDQHGDLDAVADRERQLLEQLAAAGELAGKRLREAREPRRVEVQQRPGHQLRDATALCGSSSPSPLPRPIERALHEHHPGRR